MRVIESQIDKYIKDNYKLVRLQEASQLYGIPRKTLENRVNTGLLPVVLIYNLRFVLIKDMEKFSKEYKPRPRRQKMMKDLSRKRIHPTEKYTTKSQRLESILSEILDMIVPISELPEGFQSLDWKTSSQIANDLPFIRKPNAVPLGKALSQLVRCNKIASKIKDGKTLYGIALDISAKELLEAKGMLFSLDSYRFWKKVNGKFISIK